MDITIKLTIIFARKFQNRKMYRQTCIAYQYYVLLKIDLDIK